MLRIFTFMLLLCPMMVWASSYERGITAKQAGNHELAARELAAAVEERPDHVEAWFHYGTVLGWLERFDEAEPALRKGLEIAPKDYDLRMALARVTAWKGDHAAASHALAQLAAEYPDDLNVRVMQGRVATWSGRNQEARRYYKEVLKQDPRQVDALVGMGDLAYQGGDLAGAEQYFTRAMEVDPSPDIQGRLEGVRAANKWRLDGGVTFSTFDESSRSDWFGYWLQTTLMTPHGSFWLHLSQEERFDNEDTSIRFGWAQFWDSGHALGLHVGGSPDADWAEQWRLGLDYSWTPEDEAWPQLLLDVRRSEYAPRGVWLLRPGISKDVDGLGTFEARWIHVRAQGADPVNGWLVAWRRDFGDHWWLRAGYARGAETTSGNSFLQDRTLRSESCFLGVGGPLNDVMSWRLDLEREWVRGAPDRDTVSLGVQYRF